MIFQVGCIINTKLPSCGNIIRCTLLGFPSWCPESTRPTDLCFQGTSCENLMMYGRLYQHTRLVLYIYFIYYIWNITARSICFPEFNSIKRDWYNLGQEELREALGLKHNTNPAKNVIIFIGDGMGISTVSVARIFNMQVRNKSFDESEMSWEKFPHVGLAKVSPNYWFCWSLIYISNIYDFFQWFQARRELFNFQRERGLRVVLI